MFLSLRAHFPHVDKAVHEDSTENAVEGPLKREALKPQHQHVFLLSCFVARTDDCSHSLKFSSSIAASYRLFCSRSLPTLEVARRIIRELSLSLRGHRDELPLQTASCSFCDLGSTRRRASEQVSFGLRVSVPIECVDKCRRAVSKYAV